MKAIRISSDNGEYFVSAKSGANFKSDSVWHDVEKAFARAWALMEGDAMDVESQRLVARVRELEAQNAELRDEAATWKERAEFSYGERSKLESQCGDLQDALDDAVSVAKTAFEHWDNDQDSKVGKYLLALAGRLPGYDGRTDAVHKALSNAKVGAS